MDKTPGYMVKTKNGKIGRTFHGKGLVKGKVPVYLCKKEIETFKKGHFVCVEYEKTAILCDPATLNTIGFID